MAQQQLLSCLRRRALKRFTNGCSYRVQVGHDSSVQKGSTDIVHRPWFIKGVQLRPIISCINAMENGFITGVQCNANLVHCESDLFFETIHMRLNAYLKSHPSAKVISLAVGDATEPIPEVITSAMEQYARGLSTIEGFSGYGPHQGIESLRNQIVEVLYKGLGVKASEVFASDGAKGSLAHILMLFGSQVTVAVQDPSYPVISQICNIFGPSRVTYWKSDAERGFFPDLSSIPRTDLIYLCSPNNPTGIAATWQQLEDLVAFARKNGSIILHDSVYSPFIKDDCPKSIYEIPGAKEVAIEVGSFSKSAGFTGVRLGWAIVPESLSFANGRSVIKDYHKITLLTTPAGPSNIAQAGGLACLTPEGFKEVMKRVEHYQENANILLEAFSSFGLTVSGGRNSPYIWVEFPGKSSEDIFNEWFEKANVLTCPGVMFGPSGEEFLRVSAFGRRENILEAVERLKLI